MLSALLILPVDVGEDRCPQSALDCANHIGTSFARLGTYPLAVVSGCVFLGPGGADRGPILVTRGLTDSAPSGYLTTRSEPRTAR